jgi:hypothetical protein
MTKRVLWLVVLLSLMAVSVSCAQGGGPAGGAGQAAAPRPAPNPAHWVDVVHWLGIIGTGLAVVVFLGGAILYLGFNVRDKDFDDPTRRIIRDIHMTGGLTAITLGVAHYVGRCVQLGKYDFGLIAPVYAGGFFAVVALSGILRFWTPRPWRKHWIIFAYLHRLAVVGALYFVTKHTLYQIGRYTGK